MKAAWFFGWVVALLWPGIVSVWLYEASPPYAPLGGDTVEPRSAPAGSVVSVNRVFRATRDDTVYIARAMTRGHCPKNCEIVDLPGGWFDLSRSDYTMRRDHVIPPYATPGVWTLAFTVHWEDIFGRRRQYALPPLEIEVTASAAR